MEIIISDGKENVLIRGAAREYEMCFQRTRKGKPVWEAEKYFPNLSSVFNELLNRKVRFSDAKSLLELKETLEKAKAELTEVWQ